MLCLVKLLGLGMWVWIGGLIFVGVGVGVGVCAHSGSSIRVSMEGIDKGIKEARMQWSKFPGQT